MPAGQLKPRFDAPVRLETTSHGRQLNTTTTAYPCKTRCSKNLGCHIKDRWPMTSDVGDDDGAQVVAESRCTPRLSHRLRRSSRRGAVRDCQCDLSLQTSIAILSFSNLSSNKGSLLESKAAVHFKAQSVSKLRCWARISCPGFSSETSGIDITVEIPEFYSQSFIQS